MSYLHISPLVKPTKNYCSPLASSLLLLFFLFLLFSPPTPIPLCPVQQSNVNKNSVCQSACWLCPVRQRQGGWQAGSVPAPPATLAPSSPCPQLPGTGSGSDCPHSHRTPAAYWMVLGKRECLHTRRACGTRPVEWDSSHSSSKDRERQKWAKRYISFHSHFHWPILNQYLG